MNATGRHLLVEYKDCDQKVLNDRRLIEELMRNAATAAGTTIVTSVFHPFFPQGISGVVVIEESHLSIHTWPEYGYAAVDFFTCGDGLPERAYEVLKSGLKAQSAEVMYVNRGAVSETPAMEVVSHVTESGADQTIHFSSLRQVEDALETDEALLQIAHAGK